MLYRTHLGQSHICTVQIFDIDACARTPYLFGFYVAKTRGDMCYALLATCRLCTWLLTVTYPRCSHAKAYAIDPPACPYRMKRQYKSSGLCSACKTHGASSKTSTDYQGHRKGSLSVTPCEVRIEFRDTEVGRVEERDKVVPLTCPPLANLHVGNVDVEREDHTKNAEVEKATRKRRAKKASAAPHTVRLSVAASDTSGDVYIQTNSPSPSVSSTHSFHSLLSDEDLLPRKHKSGTRSKPLPKPRRQMKSRKRRRSPGVLERTQMHNTGILMKKKGRRGRPPKQKIIWPGRIDAGAFDQVVQERESAKPRGRPPKLKLSIAMPKAEPRGFSSTYLEQSASSATQEDRPSSNCVSKPVVLECASKTEIPSAVVCSNVIGEGDDLARIIAFEAKRRDKKWR